MEIKENNIYLGDSYELIKSIPDKSIDLIVTDPPYEIEGIHPSGVIKERYENSYAKELADKNLDKGIDLSILKEFVRVLKKINIYLWCNKEQIIDYLDYFVKEKGCNWEMLIWAKDNPAPFCGTHYLKDKEYCLYFWETGAEVSVPYERGKTVFMTKVNKEDKKLYLHPTIKPVDIIKILIENSSNSKSDGGGIIFDPFLGSGTTCVAAKELGRKYIGFEINEKYYKIACDRLNGISKNGQTSLFDTDFEQLNLFGGNENE